jgi:aspartyl-tRNA(Asn)/glutamyl-tRNA(Gln) amidotransferase subunit B
LGLSEYDAAWLTDDPEVARYFEAVLDVCGEAKLTANWIMGDWSAALNQQGLGASASAITPQQLGALIGAVTTGTINGKTAKALFDRLWREADRDRDVARLIREEGLEQVSDTAELERLVNAIVAANPEQVAQFRAGKEKVLAFFVGQLMKETRGKANPREVNELLRRALSA